MKVLPGSQMRDAIAALLRMHYSGVEVEVRVGSTTADVVFTDDTQQLFPRKIAIESKDWDRPPTSADLSKIYQLYHLSLMKREIDNLWIIGRHPLGGSPRQTVSEFPNVAYTTYEQFQANLINFSPILHHNVSAFQQDESFGNFIETRTKDSRVPLLSAVREWIAGDKTGLVIYGGYGLGKTTFSKYLAHELSNEYLDGASDRIPIRFALGDIFHKQDIVSLVSSALAGGESGVQVKNFSYSLFLEMNRLGKLLLIFDGFDEMRHAIDLEDFLYNFEQMRSLFAGRAKIVILGRPDAFLSSAEEMKVLSSLFENPKATNEKLELMEVGFFDRTDIDRYLSAFMNSRDFDAATRDKVSSLVRLMPETHEDNILSRPVQLKMFTRVVDDFVDETSLPNRYELYESFIYSFGMREKTKRARAIVDTTTLPAQEARARFMQNTAWWLLTSKKENRFLPSEISRDMIPGPLSGRHGSDAALREALVGSVIEPMGNSGVLGKKGNRYYYFPHKSYIEFLVAQYFSYAKFSPEMYRSFIECATPEIASFVQEGPQTGIDNLRTGLGYATGKVPFFVIEAAVTDKNLPEELSEKVVKKAAAARTYTYYVYLRERGNEGEFVRQQITQAGTTGRLLALINCAGEYLKRSGDIGLARVIVLNFLTSVFDEHKLRAYVQDHHPAEIYHDDEIGVKAGALRAVRLSHSHVSLFPDSLMDYAVSSSLSTPWIQFGGDGEHREIKLSRSLLLQRQEADVSVSAAVIKALLPEAGQKSQDVPVLLRGAAERYASARDTNR